MHYAELSAYQRNLGELRCADLMLRAPPAVQFGTSLRDADFLRQVDLDELDGLVRALYRAVKPGHFLGAS